MKNFLETPDPSDTEKESLFPNELGLRILRETMGMTAKLLFRVLTLRNDPFEGVFRPKITKPNSLIVKAKKPQPF